MHDADFVVFQLREFAYHVVRYEVGAAGFGGKGEGLLEPGHLVGGGSVVEWVNLGGSEVTGCWGAAGASWEESLRLGEVGGSEEEA